jgi:hypothetical protein
MWCFNDEHDWSPAVDILDLGNGYHHTLQTCTGCGMQRFVQVLWKPEVV